MDGLIRIIPGRGAFVAELSVRDIVETYQMREALEGYAARLAAMSGLANNDLAMVRVELDYLGGELGPAEVDRIFAIGERVSLSVAQGAGNERLLASIQHILGQAKRIRRMAALSPERLQQSIDELKLIVEALLEGDADRSESLVRQHIARSAENKLQHLAGNPRDADVGTG
jgi:DNA-binding GntR family transcriptional regulator